MNKKTESKEIIKAGDKPMLISDMRQQIQEFLASDDKRCIVFGEVIEVSNREEAEMLEMLLLKAFDSVREKMLISDVYDKEDLKTINFLLMIVKMHIKGENIDFVDLSPPSGVFHVS